VGRVLVSTDTFGVSAAVLRGSRRRAEAGDPPVEAAHQQARQGHQDPNAPRDSHRPSAYRIAELLGSLQGEGRPVADFLPRLTFTVLLGDDDAHAKNLAILHLPGRSVLTDLYDAVPSLFQDGRIDYNLALAIDGSFDHRRISAAHLIREAEHWNALGTGEPEQIVTARP
jgi:serine/threonine-protein kinase HipA